MTVNPVWPFTKQIDKFGYINNPNWTKEVADPSKHSPCGYWHGPAAPVAQKQMPLTGQLFGSGDNKYYGLGVGGLDDKLLFTQITSDNYYRKVSAGSASTIAITSNGSMWVVGDNSNGQLGVGPGFVTVSSWKQIPGVWMDVDQSFTNHSSVAIKKDGTLWTTGRNYSGELGLGDYDNRDLWEQVGTASNWTSAKLGQQHLIALNSDHEIYGCGDGTQGQLGKGTLSFNTLVGIIDDVSQVSCGRLYTGVIKTDGSIFMTGSNSCGQYGNGTTYASHSFTKVSDAGTDNRFIECGGGYWPVHGTTFLIKNSGNMWAAGYNGYNGMGLVDTGDKLSYVQLDGSDWQSVAGKKVSTLAIKTNGEMWGTGLNSDGELGLGDTIQRTVFERVGDDLWLAVSSGNKHMMAINWDGTYDWK